MAKEDALAPTKAKAGTSRERGLQFYSLNVVTKIDSRFDKWMKGKKTGIYLRISIVSSFFPSPFGCRKKANRVCFLRRLHVLAKDGLEPNNASDSIIILQVEPLLAPEVAIYRYTKKWLSNRHYLPWDWLPVLSHRGLIRKLTHKH